MKKKGTLILGINTALFHTAIAVLDSRKNLLIEKSWKASSNEAEKLIPNIAQVLNKIKKNFDDIGSVFVLKGPGSFTGLRVGVATANLVSYLLGIKVYAIDTFEYLWRTLNNPKNAPKNLSVILYAGRGGVYLNNKKQTKILNLQEAVTYLHGKNIKYLAGEITDEQKKFFKDFQFIKTKKTFGKIMVEIFSGKKLKAEKLIKPLYIKSPGITKSKKHKI